MSPSAVSQRLAALHLRIAAAEQRAGRAPGSARLLAVAKTATEQDLQEAWAAGQRSFAHNRVQALLRDAAFLPQAEWHAIGPLQGNKGPALHGRPWNIQINKKRTDGSAFYLFALKMLILQRYDIRTGSSYN